MCGIAGYFSPGGIAPDEGAAILGRMTRALEHRGPDGRGSYVSSHCGLASTRLAIIDLEGAQMPIFNEDRSVAVTFNGEIYNYRQLRGELGARGHIFSTLGDTEVLVHLYEERGVELCDALTGMFAFALWDEPRRTLMLGRDRFGIKPLLIAKSDDQRAIVFASEAKAILATGLVRRKLDRRAMLDVMSCGYPMPPRTMFDGVEQLAPASWRTYRVAGEGSPKAGRYWPSALVPVSEPPRRLGLDRAAEELRERLTQVVADHLIADVTVGSYLSGGIDSISIATVAARALARPLRTFSMGFSPRDAAYDETVIASHIAEKIGSDHRRLEITGISGPDYEGTIRAMEAPQVHTVAFCLFQLSRAVHEAGLKVVLTGEGSDELFAGYGAFRLRRARRWFGGWFKPIRDVLLELIVRLSKKRAPLVGSLVRWTHEEPAVRARYGLVPPWVEQWWLLLEEAAQIISPDARKWLGGSGVEQLPEPVSAPAPAPALALASRGDDAPILQRELVFEQQTRLDGWVLGLGDRLTMAHSIEARVPFLDHRIAELTRLVPPSYLLRGLDEKHLLRRAMKGTIPEVARTRKKRAFMAPITRWLFGEDRPEVVREAFSRRAIEEIGIFDPRAIEERMAYLGSGARDLRALRVSWAMNLALGTQILCRLFEVRPWS